MFRLEIKQDTLQTIEHSARESALGMLGQWWGDRLVARADTVKKLPFYDEIAPTVNIHGWVALVAHWCRDQRSKQLIQELGGVIGHPDYYMVSHGKDAVAQIQIALGQKQGTYGKSHDGFSIFYLHPLRPEDAESCIALERAENPGFFYNLSPESTRDPQYYRGDLKRILSGPWEGLTYDLTENPDLLREKLSSTRLLQNISISSREDDFVYRLRRLEDKYRIATI